MGVLLSVNLNRPAVGPVEAGNNLNECGLSAPVFPRKAEGLSLEDLKIHVLQCVDAAKRD